MIALCVCVLSQERWVPSWRSWSGISSGRNQKPRWVLSPRVWGEPTHPAPWRWPLFSPLQQTTPQSQEARPSLRRSRTNSLMRLTIQSHVSSWRCIFAEVRTILSFSQLNLLTESNVLTKLSRFQNTKKWIEIMWDEIIIFLLVKQDRDMPFNGKLLWLDIQRHL